MKRVFLASFLAISATITPMAAFAVDEPSAEDTRYFLQSTKGFWRNALGARHEFENGFTADLSFMQLRLARFAGLEPVAVKKYSILPEEDAVVELRHTPTAQVPWGVALLTDSSAVPTGGASVSVAVLDTGVANHPDLSRRMVECKDFTQAIIGMVDGSCDDRNGHGTHVAGIIAADGGEDGKGIYGLAPEASIRAYKVCSDRGSCWSDDIAAAIRTAADAGTQIINVSLGSDAESSLIGDAIAYAVGKGVLMVAAAGNDGPYPDSIDYPASVVGVLPVVAVDADLVVPDWSSRGAVVLAAPGVNIESTFKDGGYGILSGTSMAAPHISGLAAKAWVRDSETPAADTRQLLQDLARDILPAGADDASGLGLPKLQ